QIVRSRSSQRRARALRAAGFSMTQVFDKVNLLGWFHLFFNCPWRSFHPVKKLGRLLLYLLGGAVVLAFAALLAVNLYVQSKGTHGRFQQELHRGIGASL